MNRPDLNRVLAPLKPFQRRTVEHVFARLFLAADSTARFLVADEVGLGKTLVARGVIARAIDHLWERVGRIDIVYICSNQGIARANLPKLSIGADGEYAASLATRLTMLATELAPRDGRPSLRDGRLNFVSFTPGTSFAMGHSTGASPEREVLFALVAPLVRRETGLMNLLQGNVGDAERWRARLLRSPRPLDPGIEAGFQAALRADAALFDWLVDLTETRFRTRRDSWPATLRAERNRVIGRLRGLLAEQCVAALEPDLVILDEFQRFKWLLDADPARRDAAAELFQTLICRRTPEGQPVRTLLLSATPYKLYTTDAEIEQEDHYSDFLATTRFLFGDGADPAVPALRADLAAFGLALKRAAGGVPADVGLAKARVEGALKRIMCRSERVGASAEADAMVAEHCPPLGVDPACVRQYLAADALFRCVGDQDPLPFWMSAPYLPHFMRGYAINARLDDALAARPGALAGALDAHRGSLLKRRQLERWEPLAPAHAKLADLAGLLLDDGLWQLLWLPPTLPYWPPRGVFQGRDAATKALVFSAWNLVPDVVCGWLGYEAERRMLDGRLDHYEDLSNTAQLLALRERDGSRNRHRLLLLLLPCLPLADLAHPLAATGADRQGQVQAAVSRLLARLPDPAGGDVDRRWEWAWPLLLDPGLGDLLRKWRDGALIDADGRVVEPPNPEVFGGYVADLTGLDPATLGRRPPGLAALVAEVALGSPAVLAARTLGGAGIEPPARRGLAAELALAFLRLFNRPAVIALLQRGGPHDGDDEVCWRRVLGYCIDGNLQAVLDETWHLAREQTAWGDRPDPFGAAARCVTDIALTVQPPRARVHARFLETRGDGSIVAEELRLRTVFAVRFGDARATAGDNERQMSQDEVRAAFNSPFRPFVLASTSIGQEGLDFHPWCHRIVHWNLPGNPVDLEQREGRVNRYKGHAIRRNLAAVHGAAALADWRPGDDPWALVFERAEQAARARGDSDLVPCWVAPGPWKVERRVPLMPWTREVEAFAMLKRQLAAYRVVFGQPRQQELLGLLDAAGIAPSLLRAWAVDLSPPP